MFDVFLKKPHVLLPNVFLIAFLFFQVNRLILAKSKSSSCHLTNTKFLRSTR
jgi:hypothetical protein